MTDLQRRILFTLGALAVYRVGVHIPLPGIPPELVSRLFHIADPLGLYLDEGIGANLLPSFSIFALSVVPYLTAAVLMRLASAVSPRLRSLENRSQAGRQSVVRATRLLAILIATIQGAGMARSLGHLPMAGVDPGPAIQFGAAATMTAGFVVIMWISDQITLRGIGNGVALILFADIVAGLPGTLASYAEHARTGALTSKVMTLLPLLGLAVVICIVFVERSVRHVRVLYPKQITGDRAFTGRYASIPLKLNNGGFVPAIIAGWVLTHSFGLITYIRFDGGGNTIEGWLRWGWPGHPVHMAALAVLTIAMAYIYAMALLDPGDIARRLQERRAIALDAEPGVETERAFRRLIRGLSLVGGVYLAVMVTLLPEVLYGVLPNLPASIGGIGFLIAVAVAMDTLAELAHRLRRTGEGIPPGDAIAIAMEIPDQPRVSAIDVSAADR